MAKTEDILKYKKSFWKKLGDEISDKIRVQTTKSRKDVFNKPFRAYSSQYAKYKAMGGVKTRGKNKGKKRFPGQSSKSRKPDLQLTGDMMRNLQTRGATPDGVTIGWSGTLAQRVQWNDDMKRTVTATSKPLSNKITKFVENQLGRITDANIKKYASKPINLTVGR